MDYVARITTEHSLYTASAPKTTLLHLTEGTLVGGWIYFPPGPAGLLHTLLKVALHQIAPINKGEDYAMDDVLVPINLQIDVSETQNVLEIMTWNESTLYDHTLTVALYLDPAQKPPGQE